MLNSRATTPRQNLACVAAWSDIPMKEEGLEEGGSQEHNTIGLEGSVEGRAETMVWTDVTVLVTIVVTNGKTLVEPVSTEVRPRVARNTKRR